MADETILLPPPVEPIKLKDVLEERYFPKWKSWPGNVTFIA
jgi:hypothetical protein